jgi:hypothetical protein
MTCDTYKGSDFTLLGQYTDGAYRSVPNPVGATQLKFSQLRLDRGPVRQTDPTINDNVLMEKSDEVDETPSGQITSIACLRDALFWLTGLLGAPVTVGVEAPYTHTFTLARDCKPNALLELVGQRIATPSPDPRIRRFLGMMIRDMSWDMMSQQQNFVFNLLMGAQVRPFPAAAFDATPTKLGKSRAMAAKTLIEDVAGNSTLGAISGFTLGLNLNPDPQALADGLTGYGEVLPGDITLSGTITALHKDGGLAGYADAHTTKPLIITTESETGDASLVITIPSVEFSEPADEVNGKNGLQRTYNWMAHWNTGDDPVTFELINTIAAL